MSSVVVVGSCVYDMFSYVPRLPKPGEAVIGRKFCTMFGGKGANQAIQCSLLGAQVSMVAKLGNDKIGDETVENLKKFGVNTDHVTRTDKAASGTASIFVEDSGQNAIAAIMGSSMELTVQDVENAREIITKAKVVLCQLETPPETIFLTFEIAKKGGATTVWNAATGIPNLENVEKYLQLADIVVANEYETSLLSKMDTSSTSNIHKAMARIMDMGAKRLVVTLGEEGCCFCENKTGGAIFHVKSDSKINPVDATGAGDSFVGTLACLLTEAPHLAFGEILKRSCFVAGKCVERAGTQGIAEKSFVLPRDAHEHQMSADDIIMQVCILLSADLSCMRLLWDYRDRKMTSIEDKLIHGKNAGYCSSSDDDNDDENFQEARSSSPAPGSNFNGCSSNTGPKGVIEDWRRFKQLENERKDEQARELADLSKKLSLTCRTQREDEQAKEQELEDELFKEALSDDDFLKEYMKKRMQELEMSLKNKAKKFGIVYELTDIDAFLRAVEMESKQYSVIIHIYDNDSRGCAAVNGCFVNLAEKFAGHKFCKVQASILGTSQKFLKNALPTIQVYKEGQLIGNFVRLTDDLGDDFYSDDLESFLKQYGLLPDDNVCQLFS